MISHRAADDDDDDDDDDEAAGLEVRRECTVT